MMEPIRANQRKVHVLRALKEYGPLSFRVLKTLVKPPIQDRRLHDCLARLCKQELVTKRNESVFRGAGTFYQIAQSYWARVVNGSTLGCRADELHQPECSHRELVHSERCAVWANELKQRFSDTLVLRDFEFRKHAWVRDILMSDGSDRDMTPDLLMVFRSEQEPKRVCIAVEIERTRKSEKRLVAKLRKYARGSRVDGVLYLCDSGRIAEVVRLMYQKRVLQQPIRIKHYGEHFVLFSNDLELQAQSDIKLLNSSLRPVSLSSWTSCMRATTIGLRRDSQFAGSAPC